MLDFAMAMSRHFEKFGFFMGNKLILHGQLLLDDQHNMRYKQKVFVIMEMLLRKEKLFLFLPGIRKTLSILFLQ